MTERSLTVIEPGLLTTVQDQGRSGLLRFGVTCGGALDQAALILGNRLVGNAPDAAGLEITLVGPRLRFTAETVLAVTGADLGATINDLPIPCWQPVTVRPGDVVAFRPGAAGAGARAYLCLAGGIDVATVMGGRGTDLFGQFGGLDGRALRAGDRLPLGVPAVARDELLRRRLAAPPPEQAGPLRVVLGPQADRFTDAALETLVRGEYVVSAKADRMGLRLTGPSLEHVNGADMISEGIHQGSIQVPGDGQPIALTRARQTVGGYPKIATIIGADLDRLGQLRPGDTVRFVAVDVESARAETLAYRARLGPEAITIESWTTTGWSEATGTNDVSGQGHTVLPESWTPEAVARFVAGLEQADVRYLKLEIEAAGLRFEVRRGEASGAAAAAPEPTPADRPAPVTAAADSGGGDEIVAPMLGVFYRRSAPDQEPFADVGQTVAAGQVVGLIEVMKTYHEVTAARDGMLTEFLAEDGQFVEYGQVIARLG